jgi:hypothetical protein
MNKQATTILIAAILLCSESLPIVLSQTLSNASVSAPSIEWKRYYGGSAVSVSNLIQTIDGGYIFMDLGWRYNVGFAPSTVYKVDSAGNVQWSKTIGSLSYTSEYLVASSIIQTNDGGYEIAGGWTIGVTYQYTPTLVKLDAQGNIQWVANYSTTPVLVSIPTRIRTSDGGFVYWTDGSIIKTDSSNNTQWVETFNYTDSSGYQLPLSIAEPIETTDGALAILAVGEYQSGIARTGIIYLIKTEAFLPLPSPTALPTPIPTTTPATSPAPIIEATIVILIIFVVVVVTGLLIFLRKRKH